MACAASTSQRWQDGGAPLKLDSAYWTRESSIIELRPSGEVIEDDTLLFRVDRSGRVSDAEGKPVAVLVPDGTLIAEDDTVIGWIGVAASYRADRQTPLVRMLPYGQAIVRSESGTWLAAGKWDYCEGPALRACTLVTHVVAARDRALQAPRTGSSHASSAGDLLKLLELFRVLR
jgi:hypothetical protein